MPLGVRVEYWLKGYFVDVAFFSLIESQKSLTSVPLALGHASFLCHSLFVSQVSSNMKLFPHPKLISINLLNRFANNIFSKKASQTLAGLVDQMNDNWIWRWYLKLRCSGLGIILNVFTYKYLIEVSQLLGLLIWKNLCISWNKIIYTTTTC